MHGDRPPTESLACRDSMALVENNTRRDSHVAGQEGKLLPRRFHRDRVPQGGENEVDPAGRHNLLREDGDGAVGQSSSWPGTDGEHIAHGMRVSLLTHSPRYGLTETPIARFALLYSCRASEERQGAMWRIGPILTGVALLPYSMNIFPPHAAVSIDQMSREERQVVLLEKIDPIMNEIWARSDGGRTPEDAPKESELGTVVANEEMTGATIYWKGDPPPWLLELVPEESDGVSIALGKATYGESDFVHYASVINSIWRDEWGTFQGFKGSRTASDIGAYWTTGSVSRTSVLDALRSAMALPLLWDAGPSPMQDASSRWNDWPAWNAAGALTDNSSYCTIGYGIRHPNGHRLLTAAHCFADNSTIYDGTGSGGLGSNLVGTVSYESPLHDYAWIAADASGKMFVGTNEDANPGDTRLVNDPAGNVLGMDVCTQGANSGAHCYLEVINVVADSNGWLMYWADAAPGNIAVVGGDSGGPVVTGGSTVWTRPRGLIIAGSTAVTCDSSDWHINPGGKCFNTVYYYPIQTILGQHSVSLVTG